MGSRNERDRNMGSQQTWRGGGEYGAGQFDPGHYGEYDRQIGRGERHDEDEPDRRGWVDRVLGRGRDDRDDDESDDRGRHRSWWSRLTGDGDEDMPRHLRYGNQLPSQYMHGGGDLHDSSLRDVVQRDDLRDPDRPLSGNRMRDDRMGDVGRDDRWRSVQRDERMRDVRGEERMRGLQRDDRMREMQQRDDRMREVQQRDDRMREVQQRDDRMREMPQRDDRWRQTDERMRGGDRMRGLQRHASGNIEREGSRDMYGDSRMGNLGRGLQRDDRMRDIRGNIGRDDRMRDDRMRDDRMRSRGRDDQGRVIEQRADPYYSSARDDDPSRRMRSPSGSLSGRYADEHDIDREVRGMRGDLGMRSEYPDRGRQFASHPDDNDMRGQFRRSRDDGELGRRGRVGYGRFSESERHGFDDRMQRQGMQPHREDERVDLDVRGGNRDLRDVTPDVRGSSEIHHGRDLEADEVNAYTNVPSRHEGSGRSQSRR